MDTRSTNGGAEELTQRAEKRWNAQNAVLEKFVQVYLVYKLSINLLKINALFKTGSTGFNRFSQYALMILAQYGGCILSRMLWTDQVEFANATGTLDVSSETIKKK